MVMKALPLSKVYALLEPGPVVLLATAGPERPNVMAMSWHAMLEFEPPLLSCVVSNRNFSFGLLKKNKECVIAIPTAALAETVVACGNCSGRQIDKFAQFGLTAKPARQVAVPLIAECWVNLECRLVDSSMVNKYGLFILEVIQAWRDPAQKDPRTLHHRGHGKFMVAGEEIKLKSKMK